MGMHKSKCGYVNPKTCLLSLLVSLLVLRLTYNRDLTTVKTTGNSEIGHSGLSL